MLATVGVSDLESLFDEIPGHLRAEVLKRVPHALPEMEMARLIAGRAERDGRYVNFIGAGAYEHHIPAAVWELTTRGEFYSAYTPYQAEASQGTLQLLYEFQSMMASLTGLAVSNASLYDGASGLAEAVLAAIRAHKKSHRVLLPATVHPVYRSVVRAIARNQGVELVELPHNEDGAVDAVDLAGNSDVAAVVVPQPNFFGVLEDVDALTDAAHGIGALVIALVNPVSLALLKSPGEWGDDGADFAVGEGQPLGVPLSSGGPYFGFMCCKERYVRQMPGRIVGRTTDVDGKPGYTLTLQAREQHIRRSKATSNICTNQGLLVTAATIHMALLGAAGLRRVATHCHQNTNELQLQLSAIPGVARAFARPFFHECVLRFERPIAGVMRAMEAQGIVAGLDLTHYYPDLGHSMLVCATEVRTKEEIAEYARHLERIMSRRPLDPPCAVKTAS